MTGRGARERILDTAHRLFGEKGIRAVGIDRVVAESEVAKTTLYKHFSSKDDLVVAYLERAAEPPLERLEQGSALLASQGNPRLLALFDVLERWFTHEEFRGCRFTNASLELAGGDLRVEALVKAHKAAVRDLLARLARDRSGPRSRRARRAAHAAVRRRNRDRRRARRPSRRPPRERRRARPARRADLALNSFKRTADT